MKNVSILLAIFLALVAASVVRANVEIGEETGSGAINCPGTIDVTSDGTYCNGELVRGPSGSATDIVSTTESSAQSGFVAVAGMGAVIILAALM